MTDAVAIEGAILSINSAEVGQVLAVQPPGWEKAVVPTTVLSSEFGKKRPGRIPNQGPATARIQYKPSVHSFLESLKENPDTYPVSFTFVDELGATVAEFGFDGFVAKVEFADGEENSNLEATLTIEVDGEVTVTGAGGGS